ncbi:MAG: orotidine-5'-phosphate decarboxylase [Candidatus Pelagibacter sp. TMED263]|nr:MAG: orotidine-5'-phosphate decarboxylase [Candidatus Pelagibacter sp. TMED263]|tara:strand:+ start:940 stop:1638 length:699 start_codon:yes stop_codon:yes gene_type:complete
MIMKNIFIACDTNNIQIVKKIIKQSQINLKGYKIGYKFGLEFFYSKNGRKFIESLRVKNLWLDIKAFDIPNTSFAAIKSLRDLKNISYITAHVSGGLEMLKSIKNAAKKYNKNLKILGVTVLTSFSSSSIKKVGHTKSIKDLVKKQALLARVAKMDGIVCSAHEIKFIKKICKRMEIFTPGIRLKGENLNDQKRVMSPNEAFKNGATSIVMGRSLIKGNIKNNIQKLVKSLN